MSTHNICFHGEIRKLLSGTHALISGAMVNCIGIMKCVPYHMKRVFVIIEQIP